MMAARYPNKGPSALYLHAIRSSHTAAWPLAAGRWPLAAGRWPLAAGRWPLAAGRWLAIVDMGGGVLTDL